MTVVIEAQRASDCEECTFGIRPGQKIMPLADGSWAHTRCPEAPQTCEVCFTQVSVSGECMCGAT